MFRNQTFKVLSNLILLAVLYTSQVASVPNKGVNKLESYPSTNSDETQKTRHTLSSISALPTALPTSSVADLSTESKPKITCGQTILEDTILDADLACPPDIDYAIIIGASNITLDLGGHTISGYTPKTGVFATGQEGITIRNGSIDGFNVGVYIDQTNRVTMENLTVRNLESSDPSQFLFGIAILGSQEVVVRDSLFEFVRVAHKEAVEIFDSYVDVSNIEVRGGGAGVNFSYRNGVCDPTNKPSNGTVRNSRFSNVYIAGILVACSSYAWIEGNYISGGFAVGVNGSGPFPGAVTGLFVERNVIWGDHYTGIEISVTGSKILNNIVYGNYFGIALPPSLGCVNPDTGWECFYPNGNVIADNETWGNVIDLYHDEHSLGNTWKRNACDTKDGVEIPECMPFVRSIVRASVSPSSAESVNFTITFSEPVTGVDTAAPFNDFDITTSRGITGAFVTGVISISGTTYTVSVNTGSGNGTIRLNVVDDNSIVDAASNSLGGAGAGDGSFATGEVYTIIKSATFTDVSLSYWASSYIERLYNAGITGGCATSPSLMYCPDSTVTRAQMAVFLLKGMHGSSYTPPAVGANSGFTDVPIGYWAAAWIKQLSAEGITGGCGSGNYCPEATVTRAQMAVFLLKAEHGSSYSPPAASGVFTDVPIGYWADKWIEQLAVEGITGGCGAGIYCPDSSVTRAQMAVFLVKTFNLP